MIICVGVHHGLCGYNKLIEFFKAIGFEWSMGSYQTTHFTLITGMALVSCKSLTLRRRVATEALQWVIRYSTQTSLITSILSKTE